MNHWKFARMAFVLRFPLLGLASLLTACSILAPTAAPAPTRSRPTASVTAVSTPPLPSASPAVRQPSSTPVIPTKTPAALPATLPVTSQPAEPFPTLAGIYLPAAGWPVIQPLGEYTPLPAGDPLAKELQSAGYTLFQAGALTAEDGAVYTAYVFTRLEAGQPAGSETFRLAFYRSMDGVSTRLDALSPAAFSPELPVFPAYYRLINWDQPAVSQMGLIHIADPDAATRTALHLAGHAADINANGLPEFVFAAEYCPESCLAPVSGYDVFEVGTQGVAEISAGLPGRLGLQPLSTDPLVFEVLEARRYGELALLLIPSLAAWDGNRFADVTHLHAGLLEARLAAQRERLEAASGGAFEREELQAAAYSLLLLYERLGQAQTGLDAFLEATDPRRWSAGNDRLQCWLQLARRRAQDEYDRRVAFSLLPPLSEFEPKADLPNLVAGLQAAGEALPACRRWIE